ncbi:unnamed protein product [Urochloa humidicola]
MARNGKPEKDPFERVDACIRDLQDSHDYRYNITRPPATREAAMALIVRELEAGHLPFDKLDLRCFTIFALCGISIKKGTPKQASLACRAVGLLLLTLRDGSPGPLVDVAFPVLSKVVQAAQDDAPPALVAAAIDCLAVASFAGVRHMEEAMEAIWRVVVPPVRSRSAKPKTTRGPEASTSPAVLATAVSAWTFLLTIVVPATGTQRKADRTGGWSAAVASLTKILDADDRKVRMVAGEALAVCVELNLTGKSMDMDALAAKVSDLASESASKRTDNTLLREQKELFGQIAAFLDHNEPPTTTSREWHDDMMKMSTWVTLVQLNFLRKFLGNEFLKHVQSNPMLSKAYRFGHVKCKPLSIQEEESCVLIDDILRDVNDNRHLCWAWDNIYNLPGMLGITSNLAEKMLQLGWH